MGNCIANRGNRFDRLPITGQKVAEWTPAIQIESRPFFCFVKWEPIKIFPALMQNFSKRVA
jgi:hypothetical protein